MVDHSDMLPLLELSLSLLKETYHRFGQRISVRPISFEVELTCDP